MDPGIWTDSMPCLQKPGQQLCQKLCHYLQPKCHPLILDVSITSSTTVRLNIYQVCYMILCPQAVWPRAITLSNWTRG